ncbi:hypothetical protein MASR2M66_29390 [Chloroflexota bacterium]
MGNSVQIRPRGTMVVTVRITLQPGRDDDLIELIEKTPKGALSAVIREAMRSGTNRQTTYETEWTDTPLQMGDLGLDL